MKSLFYILLVITVFSCQSKADSKSNDKELKDSLNYHTLESQNPELDFKARLKATNKAIDLIKEIGEENFNSELPHQKNWLFYSLGQYDSLLIFHENLVNKAVEKNDFNYLAKDYYLIAYYYNQVEGDYERAFQNYTVSKSYYERIGDSSWVGRNLLNMGTIQKNFNDFFGSKETLTEALRFLSSKKDSLVIAQCYNLLATNHRKLLNFDAAEEYYLKAIKTTNSESESLIYQNNLAASLIDNAQYKNAIQLLETVVNNVEVSSNGKEYARVLDNLVYAKWLSNDSIKANKFLTPLQIRKNNKDKRGLIASYTHLGEYYSEDKPQKAKQYLDTVIQLSKTINMPRAEKDAIAFLMKLEPRNVSIRDRYVYLQDSLYAQELKVKTQFAKYKYDDRQKQEFILRLEKDNATKELETIRQRNQKIIFSAIGGILLIILGFLSYYFVQRTKRLKQEKEIASLEAIHETEAELSRRLHDDIGGKLNQALLLVQGDAEKSIVLDNIEIAYNQSRNFSREINAVDTGKNFKNEFLEMLRFRTPPSVKMLITGASDLNWDTISAINKTTLFKILQELMINMAKHSKATLVTIEFSETPKNITIYYADDGVGVSADGFNSKNGLRNTEKRIQAINGSITFDSSIGNGFRVSIEIPK